MSAAIEQPLPEGRAGAAALPAMAVIIVHYKTPEMLADCLATLLPQLNPGTDDVVVVDNASGGDHVERIREAVDRGGWMDRVRILELPENIGFAGANNAGIRFVRASRRQRTQYDSSSAPAPPPEFESPPYWLLLNPDTWLREGAIAALRDFLQQHPAAAAVGPRLEFPDGTPQLSAFGSMTPLSELIRGANIGLLARCLRRFEVYGQIQAHPHRAEWLSGACVLLRNTLLDKIGLLDDGFFMYFEEVDFFRRARGAGCELWHLPAAHVVHLVGQSSGLATDKWAVRRLPAYWFESRQRYFRKHFGRLGLLAADGLWLLGHAMMRMRRLFTGVSHSAVAQAETTDFLRHSLRQLRGKMGRAS